jgi:signal transduction histidine kinase/transcriptional regulator with GAF, ATPase, and Fis domain
MIRLGKVPQSRADLRGLLELTNRLSEPLRAEEVMQVVVDQLRTAVGAATAIMWSVDDPPTHATLVRASGLEPQALERNRRIPLEPWLPMGDAMLRLEPLFFATRSEFRDRYETAEKLVTGQQPFTDVSHACLPLVAHGRAIAGVSLVFPQAHDFEANERMFLTVLAHHAAQALERAALFERATQTRRRIEGLQQLTAAISSAATVADVGELATRVGAEALGFTTAALWVVDERGDLVLLSAHGILDEHREMFMRIPAGSDLPAARVVRDRRSHWLEDERGYEREPPGVIDVMRRYRDVRAYGALPLVRDDRVLGVIVFSVGDPHQFSPDERAFMATVADHCADAIARARLHDEARSTKKLLESVIARMPVGIIVARPAESTLVLTNEAFARIWRIADIAARGEDRAKTFKGSYPDGRPFPYSESPLLRALRGEVVDGLEARIVRPDGTVGWVSVSAAPVLRDDGTVDVAVTTFVDTTAEKEARAAADEAGRAKDEFLAMLSHELRNPMTPIVTALAVMDSHGGEIFREERTIIARQVRHMSRLVDDLLDIARITRGTVSLQKERVEIALPIASAIEIATPLFDEKGQTLTVDVPASGLPVVVDPARIAQAVANLLTNAAKYTAKRGSIAIMAAREAGDVCIRVRDTGVGIDPELLPKLFDVFVQADRAIDRAHGGLGIGLTIVRNLVEQSGGSVSARSAGIGHGSEFVIRLPFDAGEPTVASSAPPVTARVAAAPRRILLIEDNADVARGMLKLLELRGHAVTRSSDGPSGLEMVREFEPEVVICDIGLPGMSGYEVASALRSLELAPRPLLIALSGYAAAADRERSAAAGFDHHLAKPLDWPALDRLLAR